MVSAAIRGSLAFLLDSVAPDPAGSDLIACGTRYWLCGVRQLATDVGGKVETTNNFVENKDLRGFYETELLTEIHLSEQLRIIWTSSLICITTIYEDNAIQNTPEYVQVIC